MAAVLTSNVYISFLFVFTQLQLPSSDSYQLIDNYDSAI